MLCKVCIIEVGDIKLLLGLLVDIYNFIDVNRDVFKYCKCLVIVKLVLFGIIKVFLEIESFLLVVLF